jgi:hypothetical protein
VKYPFLRGSGEYANTQDELLDPLDIGNCSLVGRIIIGLGIGPQHDCVALETGPFGNLFPYLFRDERHQRM